MAKYFGKVGYQLMVEVRPGVWQEQIIERSYYGDVTENQTRWDSSEVLNDDMNVTNVISIVADAFAHQNAQYIRYVKWMGAKWKVRKIGISHPRLTLTLGGVYNDQVVSTSETLV